MADLDFANAAIVYPLSIAPEWRTLTSEVEAGGLGIRRQLWQAPRYRFTVEARFASAAALASFTSFVATQKGARKSFTWTCPADGVVYTCRFAADAASVRIEGPGLWAASFELLGVPP